jgi:hypothetical protein
MSIFCGLWDETFIAVFVEICGLIQRLLMSAYGPDTPALLLFWNTEMKAKLENNLINKIERRYIESSVRLFYNSFDRFIIAF